MKVKDENCEVYAKYIGAAIGFFCLLAIVRRSVNRSRGAKVRDSRLDRYGEIMTVIRDFTSEFRQTKMMHDVGMQNLIHKISKDKCDFISTVSSVMSKLAGQLDEKTDALCQNITVALDMEHLKNDQRFNKTNRMIDALRDEIKNLASAKSDILKKSPVSVDHQTKLKPDGGKYARQTDKAIPKKSAINRCDAWVQTEYEMLMKKRHGSESESVRSILTIVKKSLAELTSEARNTLSRGVEDEKRDVQKILSLLTEDRQDIKNEIIRAFTVTVEQDQKNFEQFNHIGKEAMHFMTVLNDNSNKALNERFSEIEETLKEVLTALNAQMCHMASVVENLNESKNEFDEIVQKVETVYQCMSEEKSENKNQIESIMNKVNDRDNEIEDIVKSLEQNTTEISNILKDVKVVRNTRKENCLGDVNLDSSGNDSYQGDAINLNSCDTMLKRFIDDITESSNKLGRTFKLTLRCSSLVESLFKKLSEKSSQMDVMFELMNGKLHIANDLVTTVANDTSKINSSLIDFDKENCQIEGLVEKINKCSDIIFSFVQNIEAISTRTREFMNGQHRKTCESSDEKKRNEDSDNQEISKNSVDVVQLPSSDHRFMRNVIDQILKEAYKVTMEYHDRGQSCVDFAKPEVSFIDKDDNDYENELQDESAENAQGNGENPPVKIGDGTEVDDVWKTLIDERSVEEVSNISLVSNSTDTGED